MISQTCGLNLKVGTTTVNEGALSSSSALTELDETNLSYFLRRISLFLSVFTRILRGCVDVFFMIRKVEQNESIKFQTAGSGMSC